HARKQAGEQDGHGHNTRQQIARVGDASLLPKGVVHAAAQYDEPQHRAREACVERAALAGKAQELTSAQRVHGLEFAQESALHVPAHQRSLPRLSTSPRTWSRPEARSGRMALPVRWTNTSSRAGFSDANAAGS